MEENEELEVMDGTFSEEVPDTLEIIEMTEDEANDREFEIVEDNTEEEGL